VQVRDLKTKMEDIRREQQYQREREVYVAKALSFLHPYSVSFQ